MEVGEQTKRVGWQVGLPLSGSGTCRLSAKELRTFDDSIDEYSRLRRSGPLPETLPTRGHGPLSQPGSLPQPRPAPQLQHRPRPWPQSGPLPETLPTHGHGLLPQPGFLPQPRPAPQLQHRPRSWRQPETCFCLRSSFRIFPF